MLPRAALRKLVERDFEMNRMMMKAMNMNRLRSFPVATSLLAFCLLALFSPATATAQKGGTTHEVGVDGDIQDAIDDASNGDTIQLAAGTYNITTTIDPGGKQVTILGTVDGEGEPNSILDGGGAFRVLICQSGETSTTVFQNLVIQNGFANNGGGMNNDSSSPTLTDCTFTGNSADYDGGGMLNSNSSSPTLTDCTFTNNSADYNGGGMYNDSSSPTLTGCNFCGNTSGTGNRNINGSIDGSSSGNRLLLNCNTGDVNFDLAIDSGDLGYLLALWGASSVLNADINQDGEVNGADLAYILSYFGGATDATTAD